MMVVKRPGEPQNDCHPVAFSTCATYRAARITNQPHGPPRPRARTGQAPELFYEDARRLGQDATGHVSLRLVRVGTTLLGVVPKAAPRRVCCCRLRVTS